MSKTQTQNNDRVNINEEVVRLVVREFSLLGGKCTKCGAASHVESSVTAGAKYNEQVLD